MNNSKGQFFTRNGNTFIDIEIEAVPFTTQTSFFTFGSVSQRGTHESKNQAKYRKPHSRHTCGDGGSLCKNESELFSFLSQTKQRGYVIATTQALSFPLFPPFSTSLVCECSTVLLEFPNLPTPMVMMSLIWMAHKI